MKTKDGIKGSIYKQNNKLVVKIANKRYFTGLSDTPANIKIATEIKKKLYLKEMNLDEKKPSKHFIIDLFDIYIDRRTLNREPKTIVMDKLAFKSIIKTNFEVSEDNIIKQVNTYLHHQTISDTSINIYLRHFQIFVNWLFDNKYLPNRLYIYKMFRKKTTIKAVEIFTDEEIEKIIKYCQNNEYFGILIQFLLKSGLRIGEALKLKWSDIQDNKIVLSNKINRTAEYLPLSNDLINLLDLIKKDYYFSETKVFKWQPTTQSRLNRTFATIIEQAGVERKGRNFHTLRKTFLYRLYRANVSVQNAYKLMRHNDIRVTINHYSKFDIANLKNDLDKI